VSLNAHIANVHADAAEIARNSMALESMTTAGDARRSRANAALGTGGRDFGQLRKTKARARRSKFIASLCVR